MDAKNIFNYFTGFLRTELERIQPEDFLEPCDEPLFGETILGSMNELEKALFTIQENLFEVILLFFESEESPENFFTDFYYWFLEANIETFSRKCDEQPGINKFLALEVRNQFFSTYNFLGLVLSQRFEVNIEGIEFLYHEGFMVAMNKNSLLYSREN